MIDLTIPLRVAKSGRSFDFAGHRIRIEGSAHDPNDNVPELVKFIAVAILHEIERRSRDGVL